MEISVKTAQDAIVRGLAANHRITFCTCWYRKQLDGLCDHCLIQRGLWLASECIANEVKERGG